MFKFTRRLKPVAIEGVLESRECGCRQASDMQALLLAGCHRLEESSRRQEVILEQLLKLSQDANKAQAEHDLAEVLTGIVTNKIAEGAVFPDGWGY